MTIQVMIPTNTRDLEEPADWLARELTEDLDKRPGQRVFTLNPAHIDGVTFSTTHRGTCSHHGGVTTWL